MYSKKTFLSTALDSRKYKGYSTTLPESHVPTIWAYIVAVVDIGKFLPLLI